jgi:probable F420-dependent oxidoreductase
MRTFRFIADLSAIVDGRTLADKARRAESIGYDEIVLGDHLLEQLAPIPALATVAAATGRIRIGTFVLNNDLRHPAVLAQDLATLDVLSEGRLEVGIGAGWNEPEYDAIGLSFDSPGRRIQRMTEAVAVLKGLFADGPFSFQGNHYTIAGLDGQPKPAQRPHPPFLMGGGGRRMLTFAAREADTVGLAPIATGDGPGLVEDCLTAATERKIGWIREAAGDRFDHLDLNVYPAVGPVRVTDDARREAGELAHRLVSRHGGHVSAGELLESPFVYIGSVDGLVEKLIAARARFGINCLTAFDMDQLAPVVERLAGT